MTVHLTNAQLSAARALARNVSSPFDGAGRATWAGGTFTSGDNFKHQLYFDFGYPPAGSLTFDAFYNTWRRNGWAKGLVTKTAEKTWQDQPCLMEVEQAHKETELERGIRQHFDSIRFWQNLKETDARSMVGKYAGVIFQLADGKPYNQPVEGIIPGGIEGVISALPAWEGQLEPSEWDTDPKSPNYGKASMFRFNESSVDPEQGKVRSFSVHPDRCYIWSRDGTTWGESKLEACYNALMDMEKVRGAGGEGFWKNAKSQPVLTADSDVDFNSLAAMLGTDLEGLPDALDEVVTKWSRGFDESLLLQGMKAEALGITLPQPQEFFNVAMQEVAASWPIPQKILTGMQTGERASTEDAREWAQANMARRSTMVRPNIMDIVERFERWGILPERDWHIEWPDLTAPTIGEKLEIADKMAKVNQAMMATGGVVFTDDEIRDVAGYAEVEDDGLSELDGLDDGA